MRKTEVFWTLSGETVPSTNTGRENGLDNLSKQWTIAMKEALFTGRFVKDGSHLTLRTILTYQIRYFEFLET